MGHQGAERGRCIYDSDQEAGCAGFAFLFYIAAAATGMVLAGRAAGKGEVAAKLVSIAQHAPQTRWVSCRAVGCVSALVLAVTPMRSLGTWNPISR